MADTTRTTATTATTDTSGVTGGTGTAHGTGATRSAGTADVTGGGNAPGAAGGTGATSSAPAPDPTGVTGSARAADSADVADRIAITGMAGRFPGADDVEQFWRNLQGGRETISTLTADRLAESGVDPAEAARPGYVPAKGVLEGADRFDAAFFGYSPREAELMDPQHRVFLECAWTALESAGCDPAASTGRIGVFAGTSMNSYLLFNVMGNRRLYDSTGPYRTLLASDKDFLATRVAYQLDLRGPALTVQTACSTSLTAVHLACQSLLSGECDTAIAGGVSVSVPLAGGYLHEPGGIMSADGHCRPFSADSDGTVAGNGVGVVVLRRLADALDDGDAVVAVIRGSAINNDGSLKAGYTAPGVDGQAEVIAEALAVAGVDASTIGYVETHGTGTALGDPIEIAALSRAYREHTADTGYCALGAVKANVGHLDAAAGVTALIKAALVLDRGSIPPLVGYAGPNEALDLARSPFFVNTEPLPWPRGRTPRRAGVSSFGIGGTNAHVVLEEAPLPAGPAPEAAAGYHALVVSGRTPRAVADNAHRLADHLQAQPGTPLAAAAHTLATRRRAFGHRQAVVSRDTAQAVAALRRITPADSWTAAENPGVAFLFPGQGAQHVGMGRDLHAHEPVFAAELDRCAELFAPHLGEDLRALVLAPPERADEAAARLALTDVTQPALFAVEYALARLWHSRGVRPTAMAGHSVGEYVAACLAGVFSLPDAVRLVAARGRLARSMPPGAMLGVFLPEADVLDVLAGQDGLCVAAVNSSGLTTVSGDSAAIAELRRRLTVAGVPCRELRTSHAFHSPSMDAAVEPFTAEVRRVTLSAPTVPFLSNVTGTWITAEQATDPAYWGRHLRAAVRFGDALDVVLADPGAVLLEVGPGHTLVNFARDHVAWRETHTAVSSLRHPDENLDDREHLLAAQARLWGAGVPVDWTAGAAGSGRRTVALPGYAFQRQRYWVEPDGDRPVAAPAPGRDWFYASGWRRLPFPTGDAEPVVDAAWAVLGADLPVGAAVADLLAHRGAPVVRVVAGRALERGAGAWTVDPANLDHAAALVTALAEAGRPVRLVHAWSTGEDEPGLSGAARLDRARAVGFDSLLTLAQGIARAAVPVRLDVLSRGLHAVTGDEALRPEHATLLGATTVIPQEVPGVSVRTLDVTGVPPADALTAVLTRPTAEGDLALRGRHWWVRDFDAVPLTRGGSRLRDGGVYLITGGLGGVGVALAEHIAGAVREPVLVLLSRTGVDGDATGGRARAVARLRDLGARVEAPTADVTDEVAVTALVADLRARLGGLHGVVHAAGVPSRGVIAGKTRADADAVLAAKTRGALALDRACGDGLDFLLLCSSLTSLLGGPGQSDYCAANAYLDAFAQAKRAEGAPVWSIAWDTWRGVGMAAGLTAALGGEDLGEPVGHPLLQHLVAESGTSRTYRTEVTSDHWVVDDHRIMGAGLVPGTTYLELVRAAVAHRAAGRAVELGGVVFAAPVIVPDGRSRVLYTTVEERDGGGRFTVRSRDGDTWQEHAAGSVSFGAPEPPPARDLAELLRRVGPAEVVDHPEEIKRRFKLDLVERGGPLEFAFGPRWQCLREIRVGDRGLLVTLRLDERFAGDTAEYGLHPALLDVAGASARIHARDVFYLPFTYRKLRVDAALTDTVHCFVRLHDSGDSGETLTCDTEIYAPDGRALARIEGFTIKRVNDLGALRAKVAEAVAAEPAPTGGVLRALGEGMAARDAVAAFARICEAAELPDRLVVAHAEPGELLALARTVTPELLAREAGAVAPPVGTHPRPDLDTPYAPPGTPAEQAVAEVWQEVLGLDRVGVHDDFFALGGHSLAAVQIGAKLQGRFGAAPDLRRFFDHPTVAATAALLDAGDRHDHEVIEVLSRDERAGVDELSDAEVEAMLLDLLARENREQEDLA
ncbi:SDR family NAD(P)-dependent oxidoreductase [Actinosynnema sp. NPDC059335]|uniref:type I polyketide synthase n=1 Tax=Actinosynnema sp. NPDC059335 TaxID=3346804 RepID=UPI00366FB37A